MIRVALVDDQALLRSGLRGLIESASDLCVVGEAGDGDKAIELIAETGPDVVLLDVRLPGRSGVEVLRELAARGIAARAILLTTFDDDDALFEGLKAGACGFLLKDVSFERLEAAIRRVAAGETLIQPALTEQARRRLEGLPRDFDALEDPESLTRRESEVLRLIAGGYSNREIGVALGTSEATIKNHTSTILSKLGVRDRTRAVLKALELGYL